MNDNLIQETIYYVELLHEMGGLTKEELNQILESETISEEDMENFVSEMEQLIEEEIAQEEIVNEAYSWIEKLYDKQIISEDEVNKIISNDNLSVDELLEFVVDMRKSFGENYLEEKWSHAAKRGTVGAVIGSPLGVLGAGTGGYIGYKSGKKVDRRERRNKIAGGVGAGAAAAGLGALAYKALKNKKCKGLTGSALTKCRKSVNESYLEERMSHAKRRALELGIPNTIATLNPIIGGLGGAYGYYTGRKMDKRAKKRNLTSGGVGAAAGAGAVGLGALAMKLAKGKKCKGLTGSDLAKCKKSVNEGYIEEIMSHAKRRAWEGGLLSPASIPGAIYGYYTGKNMDKREKRNRMLSGGAGAAAGAGAAGLGALAIKLASKKKCKGLEGSELKACLRRKAQD